LEREEMCVVDRALVVGWLDRYLDVWNAGTHSRVAELFSDDAAYYTDPFREPRRGLAEIEEYANIFVLRFAPDGRCSEYREWYMLQKGGGTAAPDAH
jgi:hypothetical protein